MQSLHTLSLGLRLRVNQISVFGELGFGSGLGLWLRLGYSFGFSRAFSRIVSKCVVFRNLVAFTVAPPEGNSTVPSRTIAFVDPVI